MILFFLYLLSTTHAWQNFPPNFSPLNAGSVLGNKNTPGQFNQFPGLLIPPILFPPQPFLMNSGGPIPTPINQGLTTHQLGLNQDKVTVIDTVSPFSTQAWSQKVGGHVPGYTVTSPDGTKVNIGVDDIKRIQAIGERLSQARMRQLSSSSESPDTLGNIGQDPTATLLNPGSSDPSVVWSPNQNVVPTNTGPDPTVADIVDPRTVAFVQQAQQQQQPLNAASGLYNLLRRKRDLATYDDATSALNQGATDPLLSGLSPQALHQLLPLLNLIYKQKYRQVQALPFVNTVQKYQVIPQQDVRQELVKVPTVSYAQGCKPETYQYQTQGLGIEPTLRKVEKLVTTPVSYTVKVMQPQINPYQESIMQPEIREKLVNYYKLQQSLQQVPGYKILPVEQKTVGLSIVPQTQTYNMLEPRIHDYQVQDVGYVPYKYQVKSLKPIVTTETKHGVEVVPEIYKQYGVNVDPFYYSVAGQPRILTGPPPF